MTNPHVVNCSCVSKLAVMIRADEARSIRAAVAKARKMLRDDPSLHECGEHTSNAR